MGKLGPHCLVVSPSALEWASHASVVKAVDNPAPLYAARAGSIRIFRRYFAEQDISRHGADVAQDVLAALGDAPATHVELYNETAQSLGNGLERNVQMTQEAVAYLAVVRSDLKVVGFCFSTGSPERADWEYLRAHQFGNAHVVGMHCYWASAGFTQWNALRWRQFWREGDPLVIVGECGRDRVRDGPNGEYIGEPGWKAQNVNAEAYVGELRAYAAELERDPRVLGAVVFTAGPTDDWEAFDTDGLDISSLYDAVAPTPSNEENTEGGEMKLSEQYPREYAEWVAAGGVENNLKSHLLALGRLTPTMQDLQFLADEMMAKAQQVKNVAAQLSRQA